MKMRRIMIPVKHSDNYSQEATNLTQIYRQISNPLQRVVKTPTA